MRPWLKEKSLQCHLHVSTLHRDKCLVVSLLVLISGCLFTCWLISCCADLCWLLWTQLYGSVVRAVDCRSAGPWFDSGWKSWFTFMTWSSNQIIQMINIMSPIRISIRTITRNSVKRSAFESSEGWIKILRANRPPAQQWLGVLKQTTVVSPELKGRWRNGAPNTPKTPNKLQSLESSRLERQCASEMWPVFNQTDRALMLSPERPHVRGAVHLSLPMWPSSRPLWPSSRTSGSSGPAGLCFGDSRGTHRFVWKLVGG